MGKQVLAEKCFVAYASIVSRIRKGYEARFRALLERVGARRLEQGVAWFIAQAQKRSVPGGPGLNEALDEIYNRVALRRPFRRLKSSETNMPFFCDAGLGGLARWLRAAGCEAHWQPGIADDELLRLARADKAIILTTDSGVMERRLVRNGTINAFWLPPTLKIREQLLLVFREFNLVPREPRCMNCGGGLSRVDKETLKDRIPPKTYRWLDEFFLCSRCGKLLWRGTHWENVSRTLGQL
jgi:uncharacterized protein with PIN domain